MDERIASQLADLKFRPAGAARPADFLALERDLGLPLPADYRGFLGSTGGGCFEAEVVCRVQDPPPISPDGLAMVGWFYESREGPGSLRARGLSEGQGMGPRRLPIMEVPGGDFYCLSWTGRVVCVEYWDHDSGKAYRAGSSFADFVGRLELDQRPAPPTGGVKVWLHPDLLRQQGGGDRPAN